MTRDIETQGKGVQSSSRFSLDTWAVFLALGLALLIWAGVIQRVPW
jgi:hypothetical protein